MFQYIIQGKSVSESVMPISVSAILFTLCCLHNWTNKSSLTFHLKKLSPKALQGQFASFSPFLHPAGRNGLDLIYGSLFILFFIFEVQGTLLENVSLSLTFWLLWRGRDEGEMSAGRYVSLSIFSLPAQHGGSFLILLLFPNLEAWHERKNGGV